MRTQEQLDKANRQVAFLESRETDLRDAVQRLQGQLDKAGPLQRVQLGKDRREVEAELADLRGELDQARSEVKDAEKAHKDAVKQVDKLRVREREQMSRVVSRVADLRTDLDAVLETQRSIGAFGTFATARVPRVLHEAVVGSQEIWRLWGSCGEGGTLSP